MSLTSKDDKIFDDKSLSDVLSDIYKNSVGKKATIEVIMDSFLPLIKQSKDVAYVGSVVKDLLDVSVKNDDQLVKIATIAQRLITSSGPSDEGLFSDEEKESLLQELRGADDEVSDKIEEVTTKINKSDESISKQD